jgi:predicted nucleotidyltransferase
MLHNYKINLEQIPPIAQNITDKFSNVPQVVAVALAGSRTTRVSDKSSDFDFYVYVEAEIPVEIREEIARQFADRIEVDRFLS